MRPRGVKRLFAFPFRRREDVRTDVHDEFDFHLDMRTDELVRLGMSEADARAQAAREFGNRASGASACVREGDRLERCRRIGQFAADIRQDALVALRLLGRSPGFTVVAILTLAIGIGANSAIFSALDAVLLRPLPYVDADRMVQVFETREDGGSNSVSGGAYLDWRTHQTQFAALTLLNRVTYNLRGRGTPERLTGMEASHELLQVLAVPPLLGRGFLPGDDRPGGRNDVVILTEELWRTRFGGNPSIVNTTIVLNEVPRTVIGVVPNGAWLFRQDLFFVPAVLDPATDRARRSPHWAVVFGRLEPDTTVARADAELKSIKLQRAADYPVWKQKWNVGVEPLTELVAGPIRPAVLMLLGAVSLVLLIACANVANLLLARACHRQQEIAVRAALGASAGRIVRQVLTESVVLAVLGGIGGIVVTYWGVDVLRRLTADIVPPALAPRLDARVLAFSALVTGATGLLFGILPALRVRRPDLNDTLKNGGKSATAGGRQRTQSTLVVAEVALTVVLLASAGLLLRSLANTATAETGFDPARALAVDMSVPDATYQSRAQRVAFMNAVLARVRALPGVESAGAGEAVPFSGGGTGEYFRRVDERESRDEMLGRVGPVSVGYLEALGTRLLAGRLLNETDMQVDGPRVAVVGAKTARLLFADKPAVGERVVIATDTWQIVGVVADVVDRRLDAPLRPFAYVPMRNPTNYSIVLRSRAEPGQFVNAVQREIARLDPGVAIANPRVLDKAMAESMTERRVVLMLVGAFAATALTLACIGLYGVMAYSVATRRREISIRMALGAERGVVLRHILRDGLRLMAIGLVVGSAAAVGAGRLLTTQLFQVASFDPTVIAATGAAVALVALLASGLPAWRAARLNPVAALRND